MYTLNTIKKLYNALLVFAPDRKLFYNNILITDENLVFYGEIEIPEIIENTEKAVYLWEFLVE